MTVPTPEIDEEPRFSGIPTAEMVATPESEAVEPYR
jgi:hypothetical protein